MFQINIMNFDVSLYISLENVHRLNEERQWRRPPTESVTQVQGVNNRRGASRSCFPTMGSCSGFPAADLKILNLCIFWESRKSSRVRILFWSQGVIRNTAWTCLSAPFSGRCLSERGSNSWEAWGPGWGGVWIGWSRKRRRDWQD